VTADAPQLTRGAPGHRQAIEDRRDRERDAAVDQEVAAGRLDRRAQDRGEAGVVAP
jgi:hypothetical protein